jgi:hypothetical protein
METATNNFVSLVGRDFNPDPEEKVFDSLFNQYEKVVFQSIITSFGLDSFIKDRTGGDVDTIHNVRNGVEYKNVKNEQAYVNRGKYNDKEYHNDANFKKTKSKARKAYHESGKKVEDAYTGNDLSFLGKSKGAPSDKNAELDHVISAKSIHDDKGRVLSGLSGKDLANSPENLQFTNKHLNASMQASEIPDYIEKHPELPDDVKAKMMHHYNEAKSRYDAKISMAYYTSRNFWQSTGIAAAKVGIGMGLRQTFGLVVTEIWFAVKDELALASDSFKDKLNAVAIGIKRGCLNAKNNFKELLSKFGEGAVSGIISSLTTTLCNIFFTTAKNVARIIRQTWASIVEAAKILFFNPDNLSFSERMSAALKIIATGASVVLGTMVQEAVSKALTPHIGVIPAFGGELLNIVSLFAGSLCTGLLTVSLLSLIDSDPFGGFISKALDKIIVEYKRQAKLFEEYAAKLAKLDIEKFAREATLYRNLALSLETVKDEYELNRLLHNAIKAIGVAVPWGENKTFDEFMNNESAVLHFSA